MNWNLYPNFSENELKCQVTGHCDMDPYFMSCLQELRTRYGKPMAISSGFRDPLEHPIEAKKSRPGAHGYGVAADILVSGAEAHELLKHIMDMKAFSGIGFSQSGVVGSRFIHVDTATSELLEGAPRPHIWSY